MMTVSMKRLLMFGKVQTMSLSLLSSGLTVCCNVLWLCTVHLGVCLCVFKSNDLLGNILKKTGAERPLSTQVNTKQYMQISHSNHITL